MSLQVWLPLNGNLENQGLSNIAVTNNGATVDNNGKLGQCYSIGSNKRIYSTIDTSKLNPNEISFACWVYVTSWNSSYDSIMSIADGTGWNQSRATLCRNNTASTLTWNIANNSSSARVSSVSSISLNTWNHIATTYDGTTLKIYINGILDNSASTTLSIVYTGGLNIGSWSNGNNYPLTGKINDVRIYNHCLSPKEVEEISKGLILHYKLDDPQSESTTNLVTSITSGGQTTVSNNIVTTSGSNADTYFTLNLSESIVNGTQYTISCYAEMPIGTNWTFPIGAQSNSSLSWVLYPGYNTYTFTANNISWGTNRIFMDDLSGSARSSGVSCKFFNFQVEKKNHATGFAGYGVTRTPTIIYDCSGYKRDGTITGTLKISPNSPRYNTSTWLPDSACAITIGNLSTIVPEGIFSFNIWFKKITGEWSSKGYETILGGPSGFELEAKNSGTNSPVLKAYSWGGGTYTYTLDEWHMLTMVRTTADAKFYMDGTLIITGSAGSIPSGNYFIGAWSNTGSQNYRGYFSDARIYSTALTEAQIKELFNTSMTVDSSGNIHAREVVEL